MKSLDTIAALATPPGRGGIAVVRVSGRIVPTVARALLGDLPNPRFATAKKFLDADGVAIDHGLAIFFSAPHSFTGEDVLELHTHGAPVVVDMLLKRLLTLGVRLARPGEFSERAFLNGKLDLAQAEAIADLISAGSEAAARSALRSLSGEFSRRISTIVDALVQLRMYVEAAIDFPEEEIDFLADNRIAQQVAEIKERLESLQKDAQQGALLQSGMTVVLAGAPNAGKSSLLNALTAEDTAIVSPVPGTTRDIVRARIDIDGLPLHILDTAGLRLSKDSIEREGIERAKVAMAQADRVLFVVDDSVKDCLDSANLEGFVPAELPRTRIYNKIDITGRPAGMASENDQTVVALSAKTKAGVEELRTHLKQCAGYRPAGEGDFIARRRHLDAITRAREYVTHGERQLHEQRAGELLAEDLRRAQQALGEITGEFTSDDLLGRIFSNFCIGK